MITESQRIAIRKCYTNLCYAEFVLKMLDWQSEMTGKPVPKRAYNAYETVIREAGVLIDDNPDVMNAVCRMNGAAYFFGYLPHNA